MNSRDADGLRRLVAAGNRGSEMSTIGIDCGAKAVRALAAPCAGAEFGSAVVGRPSGDEAVPLDESDHNRPRRAPAGLGGDLRLPSAHAEP